MHPLPILIAAMQPDLVADLIAAGLFAEIGRRADVTLLHRRVVSMAEVACMLDTLADAAPCGLVVVGGDDDRLDDPLGEPLHDWLRDMQDGRPALLVAQVALDANAVRIDAHDVGIATLVSTIAMLAGRHRQCGDGAAGHPGGTLAERPLLAAALAWVHATLAQAVTARQRASDEWPGLVMSHADLQGMLDGAADAPAERLDARARAETALEAALAHADVEQEPLAAIHHRLGLDPFEWRLFLLALAPELDLRYQKCVGFLLDDMGQRAGTLALFAAMLGDAPAVRRRLAQAGRLAYWRLFGGLPGDGAAASDAALRVDPAIVDWLLGRADALAADARLHPLLRTLPWPGATLLRRPLDTAEAARLRTSMRACARGHWLVLSGPDTAGWRALLELSAAAQSMPLRRCDVWRLAGADRAGVEDAALRLARLATLAGDIVVLDAVACTAHRADDDTLALLLAALSTSGQGGVVLALDPAPFVRVLAPEQLTLRRRAEADGSARGAALVAAAHALGLVLDTGEACAMGAAFPLDVDGLDLAGRLARARGGAVADGVVEGDAARSAALLQALGDALRDTAARDITPLVNRIAPRFALDDVILPPERHAQLGEIVANVRLARKVLDEWRFADKLPYGRGVTVLFHGPSGTGKTMAAQAVPRALGIDLFAIDLSRVVSKYIGETEKNIDAVFCAAERAGAAVLIDEADALFGKRSEVKDAHDRYANIEVAYLLQRMEAFDGLAILTTNLRQNLDSAFLRRLRFVIDFPRPDAAARESIWRQCLPDCAHRLGPDAFRLLARKVELTGGHIRQITLRAAFAAAADDSLITLRHIGHALAAELAKLGLPAVQLEALGKAA